MSVKAFEGQFEGEEVLYVFRKHPVVMRKGLLLAAVAVMLGTVAALFKPQTNVLLIGVAIGLVMGLIIMLPGWISWFYSVFIVTNQRLIQITQKGLFHRSVVDMGLNQIQMVNYEIAGFQETLLGFGTIMMQTFVGDLIIHDVRHPAHIQRKILEILREQGIVTLSHPLAQEMAAEQNEAEI